MKLFWMIIAVIVFAVVSSGCIVETQTRNALNEAEEWWKENRDQIIKDAEEAGRAYAEKKLIEKDQQNYQEAVIFAEEHGIAETKVDTNMDGVWTDEERISWQKFRATWLTKDVVKIATEGFLRGDDKETIMTAIKQKYPDLWEALGGGGILTLLGMFGLNKWRNGTRKTELDNVTNGTMRTVVKEEIARFTPANDNFQPAPQ